MKHFDNRYHYMINGVRFSYPTRVSELEQHLIDPSSDEEKQLAKEHLLERLRSERDHLLKNTDWKATVDYPKTDKQSWLDYRQALRDLPATAEPQLDEQGNLTNITWPDIPE